MNQNDNGKRDTKKESRKGRPPKNGVAMTATERKREQREREKSSQDKSAMPSWLRIRHRLWELVQDKFIFSNALELANAIDALGEALSATCIWQEIDDASHDFKHSALRKFLYPESQTDSQPQLSPDFLPSLGPYKPCQSVKAEYPKALEKSLYNVICDIRNCHEKEGG